MTAAQLLEKGRVLLKEAGIEEWKTDAWYLLEYVAGMTRHEYLLHPDREMEEEQGSAYLALIAGRSAHVPLQYLTGTQEFMGLSFRVDEHVLIPRQDTETLVEEALGVLKPGMRVLDLCTGSGCVLLSLLHHCSGLEGTATDLSREALKVAKENAERLGIRAEFLQGDLFGPVTGRYDCIVSNPPYIARRVVETLMEEVRGHEPRMALDGGADGLDFYRRIAVESPEYLKDRGRLFLEIGYDQGEAVAGLLEPAFDEIRIVQDLAGLDRVVSGVLRS